MSGEAIRAVSGRFDRLEAIPWWDQRRMAEASVLLVGVGALGNEVLKNLALLGVGRVVIVDRDVVEESNLCRSVLFDARFTGRPKAEAAAEAARRLWPDGTFEPLVADVLGGVGLGRFLEADAVVGALDNREARLFVNSACAKTGRVFFDGGIEVLRGIVRGFRAPETACYECTMSAVDRELVDRRRSCSLLARRAFDAGGVPTTPTSASVIGAIEAQEVAKLLHGLPPLLGRGFFFDGASHESYPVSYPIDPDCGWHEAAPEILRGAPATSETPLRELWPIAVARLGGVDAVELSREMVERLDCVCGGTEPRFAPVDALRADEVACERCGAERIPIAYHSLSGGSPHLGRSARELGLPPRDVVFFRRGERWLGIELDGRVTPEA